MQSQTSRYLVHTIFNQLSVVLGHAELLAVTSTDARSAEAAGQIKGAALSIRSLLKQLEQ